MSFLKLSDLKTGQTAKIVGFYAGDRPYRQKLLAMGLTPHTEFQVIRRAPLGDPIQIQVRDFHLSLRKRESSILKIVEINSCHP